MIANNRINRKLLHPLLLVLIRQATHLTLYLLYLLILLMMKFNFLILFPHFYLQFTSAVVPAIFLHFGVVPLD